jgi:hypothetical protein
MRTASSLRGLRPILNSLLAVLACHSTFCHLRMQQEGLSPIRCWHLDLGIQSFQNYEKMFLIFINYPISGLFL